MGRTRKECCSRGWWDHVFLACLFFMRDRPGDVMTESCAYKARPMRWSCWLPSGALPAALPRTQPARTRPARPQVLSSGKIIFHGPRELVLPFFEGLGFACPERKGIAEFLQEVPTLSGKQGWPGWQAWEPLKDACALAGPKQGVPGCDLTRCSDFPCVPPLPQTSGATGRATPPPSSLCRPSRSARPSTLPPTPGGRWPPSWRRPSRRSRAPARTPPWSSRGEGAAGLVPRSDCCGRAALGCGPLQPPPPTLTPHPCSYGASLGELTRANLRRGLWLMSGTKDMHIGRL